LLRISDWNATLRSRKNDMVLLRNIYSARRVPVTRPAL
jgi:hypothetical protein